MAEERKDCCCEQKEELRQFVSEDWRRGEKRVKEDCDSKVTEVYLEPLKLNLFQRINEQKCQVVCRRETETFDADGKVVEKVVEDMAPEKQLRIVDHIAVNQTPATPVEKTEYATKDDLQNLQKSIVDALASKPAAQKEERMFAGRSVKLLEEEAKKYDKETIMNAIFLAAFVVEAGILGWVVFFMP